MEPGSLDPGMINLERITRIVQDDTYTHDSSNPRKTPTAFHSKGFDYTEEDGVSIAFSQRQKIARKEDFCHDLYAQIDDVPMSHVSLLDQKFSELLVCNFELPGGIASVADQAKSMLERLPDMPIHFAELPSGLHGEFFHTLSPSQQASNEKWICLKVARYFCINVVRVAVCIILDLFVGYRLSQVVNDVAELLNTATKLSSTTKTKLAKEKWFVVRAFLWTAWQRCVMLYLSNRLAQYLKIGFIDQDGDSRSLRSTFPVPDISVQELSKRNAGIGKPDYMCTWAFELLRSEPSCIAMDFRRFFLRYSDIFAHFPPRCSRDRRTCCSGSHPHACLRFKGLIVENQSAHDQCDGDCPGLIWDEESYRSVSGARAVTIHQVTSTNCKIRYTAASHDTLAISHVWSHGQGGRPEERFNHCLHRRFCEVAEDLGCDSYWMDTPCIPQEHELRREAIMNINKVFTESRVTLICDKDVMKIDVNSLTIEVRESLLATLIVSDWNLRAWTFLEAFRGRNNIFLLCKNNAVVSLRETVDAVHSKGSIDISILLLNTPQLLPGRNMQGRERDPALSTAWKDRPPPYVSGFLNVAGGGKLLSHRPASRPGDDVVIWSLLLSERVYEDAEALWRSRIGSVIEILFLVTTAPRVDSYGLRWAPSTPQVLPSSSTKPDSFFFGEDGRSDPSELGDITSKGLAASWLIHRISNIQKYSQKWKISIQASFSRSKHPSAVNLQTICKSFLQGYRQGALLLPTVYKKLAGNDMALSPLVVVCGRRRSDSEDDPWEWKGVFEWDTAEPLPQFTFQKQMLLV